MPQQLNWCCCDLGLNFYVHSIRFSLRCKYLEETSVCKRGEPILREKGGRAREKKAHHRRKKRIWFHLQHVFFSSSFLRVFVFISTRCEYSMCTRRFNCFESVYAIIELVNTVHHPKMEPTKHSINFIFIQIVKFCVQQFVLLFGCGNG